MSLTRTNFSLRATLTTLAGVIVASVVLASSSQNSALGRDSFEKRCTGCHALDRIKVGPPLRGVYGRRAGKDPQFAYSDSLKTASVTWDDLTLDRWLTDTESIAPDNDMAFRLNDPADRANIIAYLRQLSAR